MVSIGIRVKGIALLIALLVTAARPARAQSISGLSITKNAGNDADSSSNPAAETSIRLERKTTVSIQASGPSGFTTRYAEGIGVDTGGQTQSLSENSDYTVQFTVTAPSTYFVTVDTHLSGDLNLKDDSTGAATASVAAVTGTQTGGTLTSGSLNITAPGTLTGAAGENSSFNSFQSARIEGVSGGSPVVHTLTFIWNASCSSNVGDECGVRLGIPINLNSYTAGNYPGTPARAQGNDGHSVTVTLHPCGDGILDTGESCDLGAQNGQPGTCCDTSCQFSDGTVQCRASAGVCDPAEFCDGVNATCPSDAKSTGVCRPAQSQCDIAESCDGQSNGCPGDAMLPDGTNCSAPCFTGAQCSSGMCVGGSPLLCPPLNGCPQVCNPATSACQNDSNIESRPCMTCADGIDNDADNDTDADDADCATLSEAQHFALIARIAKGKSVYVGSQVLVNNAPGSVPMSIAPFPLGPSRGGVCGEREQLIAGAQIAGSLAAADNQKVTFGNGRDINVGASYAVAPMTTTVVTTIAPVVGPGNCSDAGMAACTLDMQCTLPATCEGMLLNPGNPNVDTTGTHEEYVRCGQAKSAMSADEAYLYSLPVSNPAYSLGSITYNPGGPQPVPSLSGPGPHILRMTSLRVAPGAVLTVTADDPNAVVVIQVDKALKIGKTAQVQTGGMLKAENLLWVAHGKGSVKINGFAMFVGNVLAPERTLRLGQNGHLDGGLIGNKIKINGPSSVTHRPFTPLL